VVAVVVVAVAAAAARETDREQRPLTWPHRAVLYLPMHIKRQRSTAYLCLLCAFATVQAATRNRSEPAQARTCRVGLCGLVLGRHLVQGDGVA